MSNSKEFQGKSLDDAIQEACDHYDMKRDKLEVEIVSGGSTGIFGLVGAKPAMVRARPRNVGGMTETRSEPQAPRENRAPRTEKPVAKDNVPAERPEAEVPAPRQEAQPPAKQEDVSQRENKPIQKREPREQRERKPRQQRERKPQNDNRGNRDQSRGNRVVENRNNREDDDRGNRQIRVDPFSEINKEDLELTVREVTITLIEQLVMAPKLDVKIGKDRVNVLIDEPEHSGLIIGREGQTLSSLQYLVNRIVSRRMETSVRVQIDTGDYRERQDDKLRDTAEHLAEKARKSGRTQSTKPLSSYHRRIVHLALQDDERVFTRSKGDGPMKRVLVVPKKRRGGGRSDNQEERAETNGNR